MSNVQQKRCRFGFTLIEVLVVVAIIALLLAILLPSLAMAREEGRSVVCRSNLRQVYMAARIYADAYKGWGPALGHPYTAMPNWALVVQRYAGKRATSGERMFSPESILVCPSIQSFYAEPMTRTYATNVTGHAGMPGDPDNYDDVGNPAHVQMDRIRRPGDLPISLDAARTMVISDGPPAPRTASVIDFRQESHVEERIGWFHANRHYFNSAMYDGSCGPRRRVPQVWEQSLP